MTLSRKTKRQVLAGGLLVVGALVIALLIWIVYLDRIITAQFEGRRWTLPAQVYAEPLELYAGQSFGADALEQELRRLGYRRIDKAEEPGSYSRRGNRIDLVNRRFQFWDALQEPQLLSIDGTRQLDRQHAQRSQRGSADLPPRPAADRQHLSDPRRGSRRGHAGAGLPAAAGGAQGGRGSQVRLAQRRGLRRDRARRVGEPARRADRAGRLDAHAAAGQELLPRQPPHARAQAGGSDDGVAARSALREAGPDERVHQRDLSRPGRQPRGARLRPGEPVLLRQAARRAAAARSGAARRDRARSVLLRSAPARRAGRGRAATSC